MKLLSGEKQWNCVVIICSIFIFTACTNLKAVNEWSRTSVEATQYNEIVTTYSDTPIRLIRYDSSLDGKKYWEEQHQLRNKQAEALKQMLAVVSDYMHTLATLSAESITDYKEDVDDVTSKLKKLNIGIKEETLGATGSLVKLLLGSTAKIYQERSVAEIVNQANEPFQLILKNELREIINTDFRNDLKAELSNLNRYYKSLLQTSEPSAATDVALSEWKEFRIQQNKIRMEALDAYLKVLDILAVGHQKLYDNKSNLDTKILIKDLYSLAGELRKQIKILVKSLS